MKIIVFDLRARIMAAGLIQYEEQATRHGVVIVADCSFSHPR